MDKTKLYVSKWALFFLIQGRFYMAYHQIQSKQIMNWYRMAVSYLSKKVKLIQHKNNGFMR